jgi:chromosomal replication initiation ATPase DnaA
VTRQLVFDLPARPAMGRAAFFVSPANALAVRALDAANWPQGRMVLTGPLGAGKTHLAHVWASDTGAVILPATALPAPPAALPVALAIEDLPAIAGDAAAEARLLHVLNWQAERGGRVLMTGRGAPAQWPFGLADLASRVAAAPVAVLAPPDDALLAALLVKLFADRQLRVAPALITWLVQRIERSFAGAEAAVQALDAQALARKRPITRALAAEVLDIGPTPDA